MNIKHEHIENFLKMMAFFVEAYPTNSPSTNKYWEHIRNKYEMDCLKWGKCEICGSEELLGEWGLTWVCERPKCLKRVEELYKS